MTKKILIAVIFSLFLFLPQTVFAEGEFATAYDVVYDVDEVGVTTVTEKISLRNLTSESYATEFKLTIGSTQVFDIKASDPGGTLDVSSKPEDNLTAINIKFNQQVAGLGKVLPWTLSFKSKDFAEKSGKVWQVWIPRIAPSTNLESYNLTLAVPQSFGEPSSISPSPKSQTFSSGKIFLTFDKSQLVSSGVSANFGTIQLFDFDLIYHLENKNLVPILTKLTLPPDTVYQDVVYHRIDPKPLNVTLDNDGNFLAWYKIGRGQKLDVKVIGSAKLYTKSKVQNPVLSDALRDKYTKGDKYWETDNPQITGKLNEILEENPAEDSTSRAKAIFNYVVNALKYNQDRLKDDIERLGAVTALNNPDSAVCMEFTDLFIALARAAGIPTRELEGYAYTVNPALRPLSLNKDILHAWPEYWDEKRGWVMVDPTWQNTTGGVDYFNKLDLNHFVFAVKGSSSVAPIPAGSYKFDGEDSRDVKVTLSENDFLGKPQIDAEIIAPNSVIAGFPVKIKVKIQNSGNAFYPPQPLTLDAGRLAVLDSASYNSGVIPSYGWAEFEFKLRTKSLFDSYQDQIVITVGNQKFTKDMTVAPFVLFRTIPLMIGGAVGFMVLVYLSVLGLHFYRFRLRKK
ncbi:transglutaminase-like domain-containing protein [Patescibacteria group bacterium]|nr:transglutaminase-like domain-containing protein [Patescibacteria group bacterium]